MAGPSVKDTWRQVNPGQLGSSCSAPGISLHCQLKASGRDSVWGFPLRSSYAGTPRPLGNNQCVFQAVTGGDCRAIAAMPLSPEHISDTLRWNLHVACPATQKSRPHYFIGLILFFHQKSMAPDLIFGLIQKFSLHPQRLKLWAH